MKAVAVVRLVCIAASVALCVVAKERTLIAINGALIGFNFACLLGDK